MMRLEGGMWGGSKILVLVGLCAACAADGVEMTTCGAAQKRGDAIDLCATFCAASIRDAVEIAATSTDLGSQNANCTEPSQEEADRWCRALTAGPLSNLEQADGTYLVDTVQRACDSYGAQLGYLKCLSANDALIESMLP